MNDTDRLIALAHRILREEWARIEASPEWQARLRAEEAERRIAELAALPSRGWAWVETHRLEAACAVIYGVVFLFACADAWSRWRARRPRDGGALRPARSEPG